MLCCCGWLLINCARFGRGGRDVMHVRSRMTIDPGSWAVRTYSCHTWAYVRSRMTTYTLTSLKCRGEARRVFAEQTDIGCLNQARSTVKCLASRMEGKLLRPTVIHTYYTTHDIPGMRFYGGGSYTCHLLKYSGVCHILLGPFLSNNFFSKISSFSKKSKKSRKSRKHFGIPQLVWKFNRERAKHLERFAFQYLERKK